MSGKIVIGGDHSTVEFKAEIMKHLEKRGYTPVNMGVDTTESMDYPDIAEKTCREFLSGGYEFGIVCCGTGIGVSIAANKIKGIRCALPQNSYAAGMAKIHNNANIIAFGARIEYSEKVTDMIDSFIDEEFEGGRHEIRIDKISSLEN